MSKKQTVLPKQKQNDKIKGGNAYGEKIKFKE